MTSLPSKDSKIKLYSVPYDNGSLQTGWTLWWHSNVTHCNIVTICRYTVTILHIYRFWLRIKLIYWVFAKWWKNKKWTWYFYIYWSVINNGLSGLHALILYAMEFKYIQNIISQTNSFEQIHRSCTCKGYIPWCNDVNVLSAVFCFCLHGICSINDSNELLELVHHVWRETYKGVLCQTYSTHWME